MRSEKKSNLQDVFKAPRGVSKLAAIRRQKGSGSLVNRRGRWAMRWVVDGRTVQESTPFRVDVKADRARAEALLAERTEVFRLQKRRDQLAVLIAEREEVDQRLRRMMREAMPRETAQTLGDLVAAFQASPRRRDCSAEMLARYSMMLDHFVAWAGGEIEMRAVGDAMAEEYAAKIGREFSGSTYNKHINALTLAWKAVGRGAGCAGNPWSELPRRRLNTHVRRSLTAAEVSAIEAEAQGEWRGLIEIGLHTGLRLGDACRLRWSSVRGGMVETTTSKTGARVRLPSRKLLSALKDAGIVRGGARGDALVLPTIAAIYKRDPSEVSKRVRRIFKRAGLTTRVREAGWSRARADASFHSLRHTFVTRAIEAGVPAAIVRALVGHATAAMTDRYSHVSGEAVAAAFEKAGL